METRKNNERIFCELGVTEDEIRRVFFAAYGYSNYNHHREEEFEEFYNEILRGGVKFPTGGEGASLQSATCAQQHTADPV